MNIRDYSFQVDKLNVTACEQVTELFEITTKKLAEIISEFRRDLETLNAEFRGDGPPGTVAEAEEDLPRADYHSSYRPRHERH